MTEQEVYVRRIMFEKLEEMAEIRFEDCANDEYPEICSTMNEIAKTLLNSCKRPQGLIFIPKIKKARKRKWQKKSNSRNQLRQEIRLNSLQKRTLRRSTTH
ncbi:MAG: hypothetical protein K2G83_02815 [Ruminococcus sp.]|nr:hypothetical protein [Ruminococcus sp.]